MPSGGYSGTPLVKKLGVKPNSVVSLVGAPPGFRRALTGLPPGVRVVGRLSGAADLTLWFVSSAHALESRAQSVAAVSGGALWIAWPKKASGVVTDVGEILVRRAGLAQGLVDYKVCAISQMWSALKFARRRSPDTV